MPLKDVATMEKETIHLVAELSKPDQKVRWMKDGQELMPSEHFTMAVDGTRQILTITGVSLDDIAKFSLAIDDKETSCQVSVKGNAFLVYFNDRNSKSFCDFWNS